MPNELHVIFGGGQVGQPLAHILRERGLRVRIARRSAGAREGEPSLVRSRIWRSRSPKIPTTSIF